MNKRGEKIVVAMSGGIDSSMAALILKKQGFSPIGLTFKQSCWSKKNCFSLKTQGLNNAKKVCQKLNISHFTLDIRKNFKDTVIKYFIEEYKKGNTPNPCVYCNRNFKFKNLIAFAKRKGISKVATGHYALSLKHLTSEKQRVEYKLLKAKDKDKDQTYFLSFLTRKQLKSIIFPLGNWLKKDVYQLAKDAGFKFLIKTKQSQDICFITPKLLNNFLAQNLKTNPGKIKNQDNKILGNHKGLHFYTIGQRKGIYLSGGPYFVIKKDFENNNLIVSKNAQDLFKKELQLSPHNFISGKKIKGKLQVMAKVRYRQPLARARLYPEKNNKLKIIFKNPIKSITPGQFCVYYKENVCLGGGKII